MYQQDRPKQTLVKLLQEVHSPGPGNPVQQQGGRPVFVYILLPFFFVSFLPFFFALSSLFLIEPIKRILYF